MTVDQFKLGLKIILSCGGPNPDKETLELWYRKLKYIYPADFEKSVNDMIEQMSGEALARMNFVNEVIERSRMHKRNRESEYARNAKQLPPEDCIPIEDLLKKCKEFNANFLKDIT